MEQRHITELAEANKSQMPPTLFLSDIVKAKRKKRGRKYEEDEELEQDERKVKPSAKEGKRTKVVSKRRVVILKANKKASREC